MRTHLLSAILIFLLLFAIAGNAQIKIGANPTTIGASSLLELEATNKGIVFPRMTGAQMNAIASPVSGMFIYNTDSLCICQYNGTAWRSLCGGNTGAPFIDWHIIGNTGTTASTAAIGSPVNNNFIGNTDAKDFVLATNNLERMRVSSGGIVGIGTIAPTAGNLLDVKGNVVLTNGGIASELRFNEPSASGTNYTGFKAQTQSTDITYTLPAADATTSGQALVSNAAGTLSWKSATIPVTKASSTSTITTTSTTYVLSTGMTLTPGAGDYIVFFNSTVENNTDHSPVYVSIFANGIQVPESESFVEVQSNDAMNLNAQAYITGLGAGQTIEVKWKVSANTATMYTRSLIVQKVN